MRSMLISSFVLVSSAVVFGCSPASSSSSSGFEPTPTTVSGAVSSSSLVALTAIARHGDLFSAGAGETTKGLRILISDKPNTCSTTHGVSSTNLDLRIHGDSIGAGATYAVVNANEKQAAVGEAEADLDAVDGTCKDLVAQAATSGTITLKQEVVEVVGGDGLTHLSGSVDVTFPGGHIVGDFDADLCDDVLDAATPAGDAGASPNVCTP